MSNTSKSCPFCVALDHGSVAHEYGSVIAILDKYPVTKGHLLIMPKRHVTDFFEMSHDERCDAEKLLLSIREQILEEDTTVRGFNVGINSGEVAGQTVKHTHIHLIPRREGDVDDPRGGVRGCVPEKMRY